MRNITPGFVNWMRKLCCLHTYIWIVISILLILLTVWSIIFEVNIGIFLYAILNFHNYLLALHSLPPQTIVWIHWQLVQRCQRNLDHWYISKPGATQLTLRNCCPICLKVSGNPWIKNLIMHMQQHKPISPDKRMEQQDLTPVDLQYNFH